MYKSPRQQLQNHFFIAQWTRHLLRKIAIEKQIMQQMGELNPFDSRRGDGGGDGR